MKIFNLSWKDVFFLVHFGGKIVHFYGRNLYIGEILFDSKNNWFTIYTTGTFTSGSSFIFDIIIEIPGNVGEDFERTKSNLFDNTTSLVVKWSIKLEKIGCDRDFSIERVCWVGNAIDNMAAIKSLYGKIKPTASKK